MKKLLYIVTMLFNALGSILTMSLFAFARQFCFQNLFLILTGSVVFILSFTITILDYNNSFCPHTYRRISNIVPHVDYSKYFAARKTDFIV